MDIAMCVTHIMVDIFLHNLNYTVGSMAKLLRDLELPPMYSSWELFVGSSSTSLFKAVLKRAEMCKTSLQPTPKVPIVETPLPLVLNVQMDNATSDNKKQYVFVF